MSVGNKTTDEELMQAYQNGEVAAFNLLYDRYSHKVYAYLSKRLFDPSEREDLFQAVFLKLHKSKELYDSNRSFAPWIFTICRTTLLDHFRHKKPEVPFDEKKAQISEEQDLDSALSFSEALKELTEEQQNLLKMRYGDGLEFSQIARILKTSPLNVRQLTSRALRKFRGKL